MRHDRRMVAIPGVPFSMDLEDIEELEILNKPEEELDDFDEQPEKEDDSLLQ